MHPPASGWRPRFVGVFEPTLDGGALVAACPLYLKDHSYGEYVFDWAWADAYRRHGLAYYPKLLGAVPFTPVAGPRLLARDDALRDILLDAVKRLAGRDRRVVDPSAVSRRERPARRAGRRLDAAQHGAVPLAQP